MDGLIVKNAPSVDTRKKFKLKNLKKVPEAMIVPVVLVPTTYCNLN